MKKNLLVLTLTLFTIISCQKSNSPVVGTWQMYKDGKPFVTKQGNHVMHRYKIINDKSFTVIETAHNDSVFYGYFVGDYDLVGDTYTENIKSTNPVLISMLGESNIFKIDISTDTMHVKGINNNFDETWVRVSFNDLKYLKSN